MTYEEIIKEIDEQIESMEYLRSHPEIAKQTIMHETDEFFRGALTMLNYLKQYIEYHT
jgi:hypothetical protein